MGNIRYNNHEGPHRGFNKFSKRPDMHKATCASCGKLCTVPFKPTGNKPVFCQDCFKKQGGSDANKTNYKPFTKSYDTHREYNKPVIKDNEFTLLNAKIDKILLLLTTAATAPVSKQETKEKKKKDSEE